MSSKTDKIACMVEKGYETCYSESICKDRLNYHISQSAKILLL